MQGEICGCYFCGFFFVGDRLKYFSFFRGEAAVDAHGSNEEDEKPFSCPFHNCCKSFRTQSKLTQHVRSHTGEVSYHINICVAY